MPETCEALRQANITADFVDVSSDDYAYHRLLVEIWAQGEDVAIVEHDIEVNPDTLTSFDKCPEPWCVAPYPGRPFKHYPVPILRVALGCVRFRAEFLQTNGGILNAHPFDREHLRHWRRLDSQLATVLQRRGFRAHEHEHVIHHHDYAADPVQFHPGWIPAR